ncbi:MAG: hypothetical protein ABR526_03185 [Chthoniobacterales bacterium]
MHIDRALLIFVAGIVAVSCSQKSAPDREKLVAEGKRDSPDGTAEPQAARQPDERKIAEDCAALVRATKVVPAQGFNSDCPACPAGGSEALSFRQVKTDAVPCSSDACTVLVTIRAMFNPPAGETVAGGLTAWIPLEQRRAYPSGQLPPGEQQYRVQITYRRQAGAWRAIDFNRAPD